MTVSVLPPAGAVGRGAVEIPIMTEHGEAAARWSPPGQPAINVAGARSRQAAGGAAAQRAAAGSQQRSGQRQARRAQASAQRCYAKK